MSYIGNPPVVNASRLVYEETALTAKTAFTPPGGYTVGQLEVYINGSQLMSDDFTATDGSTVNLTTACAVGDGFKSIAYGNFSVANAVKKTGDIMSGDLVLDNGLADGPQVVLRSSGYSDWNWDNYNGDLRAYNGSTEKFRLKTGGAVVLQGGNTTANGIGIAFPATQSASSDANTLDDYEEGTWTPSLISTGTPPTVTTYQTQQGIYTKVGNLVTATCNVRATLSAIGSGTPVVRGLPFAPAGYLEGVALGLRTLLTQIPTNGMYVQAPLDIYFDGATYTTNASAYLTFTISYRV